MKTVFVNTKTIKRQWYIIDANDVVVGRLATRISAMLMGKGKPLYAPSQDLGDYMVVVNADKVRLTGKKADAKTYFRHTLHPGGGRFRTFKKQRELDSTKIVRLAVRGMLPKTVLGNAIIKKLFIYCGEAHPHTAQKPAPLTV